MTKKKIFYNQKINSNPTWHPLGSLFTDSLTHSLTYSQAPFFFKQGVGFTALFFLILKCVLKEHKSLKKPVI